MIDVLLPLSYAHIISHNGLVISNFHMNLKVVTLMPQVAAYFLPLMCYTRIFTKYLFAVAIFSCSSTDTMRAQLVIAIETVPHLKSQWWKIFAKKIYQAINSRWNFTLLNNDDKNWYDVERWMNKAECLFFFVDIVSVSIGCTIDGRGIMIVKSLISKFISGDFVWAIAFTPQRDSSTLAIDSTARPFRECGIEQSKPNHAYKSLASSANASSVD